MDLSVPTEVREIISEETFTAYSFRSTRCYEQGQQPQRCSVSVCANLKYEDVSVLIYVFKILMLYR